jgi:hypothetical protein
MSTVAAEPRHGKCRLYLVINDDVYIIKKHTRIAVTLKKNSGERAGNLYQIRRDGPSLTCTCPDSLYHAAPCKHLGAALAARLLARPKARKVVANG